MNDYEYSCNDVINVPAGYNLPDIPTDAGNAYPPDFYELMPQSAGITLQHIGSGVASPKGDWSTPQAYSWHSSDLLTTNPEIGGLPGTVGNIPYAMGAVESNTVENFEMLGNQAVFQFPSVSNWGDVGYLNASGVLAASVASSYYDELPFEDWASSIVVGV